MGPQPTVTNVLFDAFLRCKMKAHLLADGAEETDTDIPRHQNGLAKTYKPGFPRWMGAHPAQHARFGSSINNLRWRAKPNRGGCSG